MANLFGEPDHSNMNWLDKVWFWFNNSVIPYWIFGIIIAVLLLICPVAMYFWLNY